jgi:DNA polymerase-4
LWRRIEKSEVKAKTLTLKFKYADFEQHTRSITIQGYFETKSQVEEEGLKLLTRDGEYKKGVRLLGLTVSNFYTEQTEIEPVAKPVQLVIDF